MEPSVFSKIIKGEIPSQKVYEDDQAIIIMDVEPLVEGHVLVIPKEQIDHLWEVPDELYQHLMSVSRRMATHMRQVMRCPRVGMIVEGFGVPHAHIHLFPLHTGLEKTVATKMAKPSDEELAAVAERLRF